MKNKFLFILLIVILLIIMYRYKEGLQNFTTPEYVSSEEEVKTKYPKMVQIDTAKNVKFDLEYFNNATKLIYAYTQEPK